MPSDLYTKFPEKIVATTLPFRILPSKGVFLPLETNFDESTIHSSSGSKIVISAVEPGFNVPKSIPRKFAGPIVSLSISVVRSLQPL